MKAIQPHVSVIVPVFNTEQYIPRCLNSIVNQSLKNIEVIVVNDMSTDNSENIILKYKEEYPCIRYIKMMSKGLTGGARNQGVAAAQGEYIGFVDSDDWIDTNMYEKMFRLISRAQADIAVCGVLKEYSSYETIPRYSYEIENIVDGKIALELLSRRYNQDVTISAIMCNKIYRSSFLREHELSFIENNYNDDDAFNFTCFLQAKKVAITPNTYYHYFQRNNSITHTFSKKHIDDLLEAFYVIKTKIAQSGNFELYKADYFSFFERCLSFILNILVNTESSEIMKGKYINYLFYKMQETSIMNEYFDFIGPKRVRDFLNPIDYRIK